MIVIPSVFNLYDMVLIEDGDINIPTSWGPIVRCPHMPPIKWSTKLDNFYERADAETKAMLELAGYKPIEPDFNYEEVKLTRYFDPEHKDFCQAGQCSCGKVYYKWEYVPFAWLQRMGLDE